MFENPQSVFETEQRCLLGVVADGNDQAIEQSPAALNEIEMTVGHRVEGAGEDGESGSVAGHEPHDTTAARGL
jgi:hypothetical protein